MQVAAWLLGDAWLWLGLPVGLAVRARRVPGGAASGGDLLDRRMPELLAAVTPR